MPRSASREGISRSPLSMHPWRARVRVPRNSPTMRARSQCPLFIEPFSTPLLLSIPCDFIAASFVEHALEQRRTQVTLARVGKNCDYGLARILRALGDPHGDRDCGARRDPGKDSLLARQ